jgi:hypothetical protein
MRAYSARSVDQGHFVGFPTRSERSDDETPSAEATLVENEFVVAPASDNWSASDRPTLDLVAVHSIEIPTTASATVISGPQGESAVRMPRVVVGLPRIDAEADLLQGVLLGSDSWAEAPSARRSRYSLPGVKIFLIISMIGGPIAFVFGFASARPDTGIASLWSALTTESQVTASASPETTLPSTIEPRSIPAATVANNNFQLLPFQAESPRALEAEQIFPPAADVATVSMALPNTTQPAAAAPERQALPPGAEAGDTVARIGPEPEVQTPSVQISPHADTMPNAVTAKVTPSSPTAEEMISDGATDLKSAAMPNANLGSRLPRSEVGAAVWTYCTVNLIPGGQIAVQKAMSYPSCISAAKKCAGPRRYADIQFFDRPTLTSKVPLELCDKEN